MFYLIFGRTLIFCDLWEGPGRLRVGLIFVILLFSLDVTICGSGDGPPLLTTIGGFLPARWSLNVLRLLLVDTEDVSEASSAVHLHFSYARHFQNYQALLLLFYLM